VPYDNFDTVIKPETILCNYNNMLKHINFLLIIIVIIMKGS
jgi:hypothetical protein